MSQTGHVYSAHNDPLSVLGFGFHIYGLSDLVSSTTQAVMIGHDNATQSNPTDPYTYSANAYTSRTEVEEKLAGEVGLDVSAGAFASEFNATWSSRNCNEEDSAYGLCDIVVPTAVTALTNVGRENGGLTGSPTIPTCATFPSSSTTAPASTSSGCCASTAPTSSPTSASVDGCVPRAA